MKAENIFRCDYKSRTEIAGITIDSSEVLKIKMPLNLVFAISLGKQEFYEGVIVKLNSGDETGYGEAETIAGNGRNSGLTIYFSPVSTFTLSTLVLSLLKYITNTDITIHTGIIM